MSSSSSARSSRGQTAASSSRTSNGKQPAVEDDRSDEEALLADDPLARDLPEQFVPPVRTSPMGNTDGGAEYRSSASQKLLYPPSASHDSSLRPSGPQAAVHRQSREPRTVVHSIVGATRMATAPQS